MALSPGDVQTVALPIRGRAVQALAEGMPGEDSPGNEQAVRCTEPAVWTGGPGLSRAYLQWAGGYDGPVGLLVLVET